MDEQLKNLIQAIQQDRRMVNFDEAATKQVVILRILSCLGWDTYNIDEVHPEYAIGGKKVDYSLRFNNYNKVFIEVKKVKIELDNHQEQLLNYSFQEGVRLAILTNGITWWFYLPLHEGSWEQRKFFTVEIFEQDVEDISDKFIRFLSKDNVITGKAIENAENIYKGQQKQYLIRETMPKAWRKIVEGPHEILIELIANTTEKLCGYKPEDSTVEQYLINNVIKLNELQLPKANNLIQRNAPIPNIKLESNETYSYKNISAFTFKNKRYEVKNWKDLLIQVCNILFALHKDKFELILNFKGRKRPYFSKNKNELRQPYRIQGTDIFIETHLSANSIAHHCYEIIYIFGYVKSDLKFETN